MEVGELKGELKKLKNLSQRKAMQHVLLQADQIWRNRIYNQ